MERNAWVIFWSWGVRFRLSMSMSLVDMGRDDVDLVVVVVDWMMACWM